VGGVLLLLDAVVLLVPPVVDGSVLVLVVLATVSLVASKASFVMKGKRVE
jgi:hypothetical protein